MQLTAHMTAARDALGCALLRNSGGIPEIPEVPEVPVGTGVPESPVPVGFLCMAPLRAMSTRAWALVLRSSSKVVAEPNTGIPEIPES